MKAKSFVLSAVLLYCCSASTYNTSSSCADKCDQKGSGNTVQFCGTDHLNHTMHTHNFYCYYYCNVSALYPATCGMFPSMRCNDLGCPNYCYSEFSQGQCINNRCVCNSGWSGEDCSQVDLHTFCDSDGSCSDGSISFDQHHIPDHSSSQGAPKTHTDSLQPLPYGEIISGDYWYDDEYRDDHPIFNLSVMASIKISMKQGDLDSMLYPPNAYSQDWFSSTFQFDNGNIKETVEHVGIKLRGASNRIRLKKGLSISFHNFHSGRTFYHMKELNIRYAHGDHSVIRNQLVSELYRASIIPTVRGSFATLWINNIYWGAYWICEDLDHAFLKSRFKDGNGNFYIGGPKAYMTYLGDDPNGYKNLTYRKFGATHKVYYQAGGPDPSWSDLVDFFSVLNNTSDDDFENKLNAVFDVDQFLRGLVIEVMTMNTDGFSHYGNNWALYDDPDASKWKFLFFDFDLTFGMSYNQSIFAFPCIPECVLIDRMMKVPSFRTKYIQHFAKFVELVWNPNKHLLVDRIVALKNFLQQDIQRDYFFALESSFQNFVYETDAMRVWVEKRYEAVAAELSSGE